MIQCRSWEEALVSLLDAIRHCIDRGINPLNLSVVIAQLVFLAKDLSSRYKL